MNNNLEKAARKVLLDITKSVEELKPIYLQPDRAIFLAERAHIVLKVYTDGKLLAKEYAMAQKVHKAGVPVPEILKFSLGSPAVLVMKQVIGKPLSTNDTYAAKEAGAYIEKLHTIEAQPPFSGGQNSWDAFILWWVQKELTAIKALGILSDEESTIIGKKFQLLQPVLANRPIVLLHGDLQAEHILIDEQTKHVISFLDFADAQPGDPLLDIAVLSLWDQTLADLVLVGYTSIENNEETKQLLAHYRMLRLLGEIPWLVERGFTDLTQRDIQAVKSSI